MRPRSSNSHGRILQAQNSQSHQTEDNEDGDEFQNKETMVIPLTDQLF